ncbi:MAG: HAMP domain-containing sensor histidine kinase [Candidatus Moraniibacteriota bacterium]
MFFQAIEKGIVFTRKNPTILYSLALIVVITGALFANSYYSLKKFQDTADALLKSKAVLAENIFRTLGSDLLRDPVSLQVKLDQVKEENSDVAEIAVFSRATDDDSFITIAATDQSSIGTPVAEVSLPYLIAWQDGRVASTFLTNENGERYWNVVKKITDASGHGLGLIVFQLSLKEHDAFVEKAILQAYAVSLLSLFFVLLLLMNHMRFFRYALRVTKLEEVDHMKDDFISMASHELKTPLTVLRGYVDLLKESVGVPRSEETAQQTQTYLENMDSSIARLNDLIEDILNVSRIEQNRLPIAIAPVDLLPLLSDIAAQFSVLAKSKGLIFQYEPQTPLSVAADPARVKQILVNLVGNAVKYTPHGTVTLSVKEADDAVVVEVADTGLGIAAEAVQNLFAKFYRVKTGSTAKISGSGLGLWISREIARQMGGDITVESIEGVGSHFHLRLKKFVPLKSGQ